MSSNRIAAIVPMRHHSERVPGKNYRSFNGKPLYHYVVKTLRKVKLIDQVIIDTDSEFIIEDASVHFPDVVVLRRPESLRDGNIPMNEVLLNTVRSIDADYYMQTHSTNPLLESETIEKAIVEFMAKQDEKDSLFGVTRLQTRLWDASTQPVNHDPDILLRTQDLPPVYEENSCIYLFTQKILEERGNRIGYRPLMFEIPKAESWDIDEEADFQIAELLYKIQHP